MAVNGTPRLDVRRDSRAGLDVAGHSGPAGGDLASEGYGPQGGECCTAANRQRDFKLQG